MTILIQTEFSVRAAPPTDLALSGKAGLKYIVLTWKKSLGADSYIIYVNKTGPNRDDTPLKTDKVVFQVQGLEQNQLYLFQVASVNIAGVGANASVVLATSDICECYFIFIFSCSNLCFILVSVHCRDTSIKIV